MAVTLRVNGQDMTLPDDANSTLQFALRDDLGLTGTKFGCGVGQCGCCTVLIDGQSTRSCQVQVSSLVGKNITTIEGLGSTVRPSIRWRVKRRSTNLAEMGGVDPVTFRERLLQ